MLPVWTPLVLLSKFFVEIELYPLKCRAMVLKKDGKMQCQMT